MDEVFEELKGHLVKRMTVSFLPTWDITHNLRQSLSFKEVSQVCSLRRQTRLGPGSLKHRIKRCFREELDVEDASLDILSSKEVLSVV